MRAVRVTKAGGPDVLEVADVEPPAPGPGEVLVEVGAAGVNYIDTYQREGIYPMDTPYVPGLEGSGRVTALGEGVDGVAVGDRIAWAETLGSYAEQVVVPWAKAVPVPDPIADDVAVGALLQGMTAHFLVTDCRPLNSGEIVLVHAAAGGVGLLLTQLATAGGARVIATTSTAEKAELARGAGAAEVIDYTQVDDLAAEVRELTGGTGVDAVFDAVGRTTFDASLAALRKRGTLVLYGAASGPVPPLDPQRLNAGGSLYLTRPKLFDYIDGTEALRARADAVYTEVAAGRLDVRIGHRYPLEQARTAHEDLQGRRTTGKLVLLPS
ncbi:MULTISPECIES: quinone oxidoreductase family protein [Pseudonocardia]|uniref:Quinone oxidoreductase 1 n=2 Tax=Pseudonocardia TaxID=1847 RepID=A0A1Y2MV88_PSEAH|nr:MULTISPECIES: quinone oxidoreductase [Pseudonocardia]OSY39090.1 Quinone oxidoreductase 1 [Pseudonocardia autotrophica]TDN71314.1 NADPH:quinone reductase-like Zn-dependent oxidoreductase [Pseudonocardia autotrophica]BBG01988.1 quinone oxidoreductase [Pseudonocardia autotrophica]GEC23152.1 quinone oxidoreductase [Pseudonocardia saturnea]